MMGRNWNSRKNARWDGKDPWQYREQTGGYGWLIRTVAAALIFALVYAAQMSDTSLGRLVTDSVKYMVTTSTDFAYIADKLAAYAPQGVDVSVLKRMPGSIGKPADPLLYMTRPVDGKLISAFGWQTDPARKQEKMNEGVAFEAPLGSAVRAAAPGKVKTVTDSAQYGKVLIIDHGRLVETVYGHLGEVLVKPGEEISQGQVVARVGKTGMTGAPQLYFELREKGAAIDPSTRIKGDVPAKEAN